jgi:glucan 1,3-beta-glucosidase
VLLYSYLEAYKIVRNAGGTGEGKGPWISFHDGFFTREMWKDFLVNGDRMLLDSHPYMCFGGQSANPMSSYANAPCQNWGGAVNQSMSDFGMTSAGEWSNAVTDCGLFLNGVDLGTRYEGDYTGGGSTRVGDCKDWTDYANFSQDMKDGLKTFAMASMDALQVSPLAFRCSS